MIASSPSHSIPIRFQVSSSIQPQSSPQKIQMPRAMNRRRSSSVKSIVKPEAILSEDSSTKGHVVKWSFSLMGGVFSGDVHFLWDQKTFHVMLVSLTFRKAMIQL